jgi:predicted  nucleic acid-binding Zn-ribbon protein
MRTTTEPIVSGINLCDVLPLQTVSKAKSKEKETLIQEFLELKTSLISLEQNLKNFFSKEETAITLESAEKKKGIINKLNLLRIKFLSEFNYLPAEMLNTVGLKYDSFEKEIVKDVKDNLTKISNSSIISGQDVKAITDKFGFITIPYNCLNEKSFENETYQKKSEIKNFVKNSELFDIYVITPIEYYSIENHVYKNTQELGIYAGQHSMIFASVTINIPMFRSVLNTVANIGDEVNVLKSETTGIKNSLSQMQTTLQNLQRQVDRQQSQIIEQQLVAKQQAAALQRFEEMALRVVDPIMIAVKKGVDINSSEFDNSACFIGPCWGPDFDMNVALALDLKVIKNQRTKLTKTSAELWN